MKEPRNYFNVGVRFKTHAYSIVSRNDVEMTPAVVLAELEDFCSRVRRDLAIAVDAVARTAPTGHEPTPRA